jgi:hypothetical protein
MRSGEIARTALMGIATPNWLRAVCELLIRVAETLELVNTIIDILMPNMHGWQVQFLLLMTEAFMGSIFFFLDEAFLEGMINDRVMPRLLHWHPDVQGAAVHLPSFIMKSSTQFREKLGPVIEIFKGMLICRDSLARRIAGAKGLGSIISGMIMFDDVPSHIVESFRALAGALEMDSGFGQVITQFFSDFWTQRLVRERRIGCLDILTGNENRFFQKNQNYIQ